jgi:nanoRNase/pAp phosphatase (c-di-AMP/oligoRNAs hydrolase)
MDSQTEQKVKDAIVKSETIGVVVGENPNLDQMAAALSLYLLLKNANRKVLIASPTNPIVEISSLVGIDKVRTHFGGDATGDFVVSFPYQEEGEIDKVSYTIEKGHLNIIVKAGKKGLSFDEKDVKYTKASSGGGKVDLLFVIGTQNLSSIRNVLSSDQIQNTQIINIDNSENNQRFGDILIVSPNCSSVSEQIGDIALILGFAIDKDVAQNLLNGILFATHNFQNPKTSPLGFEIASIMMKQGAIRNPISAEQQPSFKMTEQPDQNNHPTQKNNIPEELNQTNKQDNKKAPTDWLAPKVYKGSSEF